METLKQLKRQQVLCSTIKAQIVLEVQVAAKIHGVWSSGCDTVQAEMLVRGSRTRPVVNYPVRPVQSRCLIN